MKKLFALLMAIMMVVTMSVTAFADNAETGSITINGVGEETKYELYKLLDLESYSTASGAYSYKVNAAWAGFFATTDALTYVQIDDAGYVTWKAAEDDDTVAAFAKLALAYAEANGIAPVKSSDNVGEFVKSTNPETGKPIGTFSNLELGYYLVDSNMGALCGLTTTNPDASINAKNGVPTIDKQVKEDSTEQWGDKNTADIGQTVEYRTTINVHAGAQNYVLHDKMSAGLTFLGVDKIEHIVPGTGTHTADASMYEVKTENLGDDCTFHVVFSKEFCDKMETNDKVIVYYSAMLNRHAIVAEDGNPNNTKLDYGEDNHTSNEDKTQTYTFGFDLVKTDSQNTLIDGAKFKIYDAATGGNEVSVVVLKADVADNDDEALKDSKGNFITWDHDNDENTAVVNVKAIKEYRRARADETGVELVVQGGNIRIVGFDNGTYYLEETEAPDGYNILTARQKFIISDANLDATFNAGIFSTGSGVHVVNKTGSMLPETGAMGTMLFITFGMTVVLGTGVLLVTKKRMSMIQD